MSMTRKSTGKLRRADDTAAYLLLAPFLLFLLAFIVYPVIQNLYYSFTNYNLGRAPSWIGLRNYTRLMGDEVFQQAVLNTVIFAVFSVAGLLLVSLCAAIALNRATRWARAVRAVTLYPYAMSMIAVSMVWLLLLDPTNGYINKLLTLLHLPRRMWLFDTSLALGCLIAISVWKDSGYCMLVLLAGMQAIDTALYDAARVDGANAFGQMRHVTLPGLKPVLLFVSVNSCIAAFKTFEQVQTMTGGDPLYSTTTIVHQIYQRGFGEYKMGYAASMSVVLLIMLLIVTALNFRAYGMEE